MAEETATEQQIARGLDAPHASADQTRAAEKRAAASGVTREDAPAGRHAAAPAETAEAAPAEEVATEAPAE